MKSIARFLIAAVCLSILALPAMAQQRMPSPPSDRPTEEKREELRKKMEAIRIARLTEELNLDEKTAVKFIPAITALDRQRRTLFKENLETLREMRTIMNAPQPDEGKLKAAISKIEKNQHEILSLRSKEFAAIKDYLSVQQQARYLLFHQEFQREMRGMVESARTGVSGAGPGQNRGPLRGTSPRGQ